jgi:hypothetical protein
MVNRKESLTQYIKTKNSTDFYSHCEVLGKLTVLFTEEKNEMLRFYFHCNILSCVAYTVLLFVSQLYTNTIFGSHHFISATIIFSLYTG